MRYQERIYSQTQHSGRRNKKDNNVNMSSDICIFQSPLFNITGATKIDCTGTTMSAGTHIVTTSLTQTIPLSFGFTANTQTFIDTEATFKFSIYKYEDVFTGFTTTPIFSSNIISYSAFSATNTTTQYIPTSGLTLDGEYLVKGFFEYSACTDYLRRLGKKIDTSFYLFGNEYSIYNGDVDYYFLAMTSAATPTLFTAGQGIPVNSLYQSVILPEPNTTQILLPNNPSGDFVVTLNGLTLAKDYDYIYSANVITLSAATVVDDIVTLIYVPTESSQLTIDYIDVVGPIPSGPTNGEGSNNYYYNTTTNKYEVYTSVNPDTLSKIIVMINGATLADNVDYYKSTTNPKRIILEGDIYDGDMITLVYFPLIQFSNGINTNLVTVNWTIDPAPQTNNGEFTLEVGYDNTFSSFYFTGTTNYIENVNVYTNSFNVTGSVGTQYFYRVKNNKKYTTLCGDEINNISYSDTIPIKITTNSVNSY
jgi:hypothetical protein